MPSVDYDFKMLRPLLILFSLAFTSCSTPTTSAVAFSSPQLPPPKGAPDIFKKYSTTGDATMMGGWVRNFDFSGVSFDQRQTATLVTRRHVVMANHYKRKIGGVLIFHSRQGKRIIRSLTGVQKVFGDVAVGLLNQEVPEGYKVYPLPAPREDYSHLVGRPAAVTDQKMRVFFHDVTVINKVRMVFKHQKPARNGWGKTLIGGDSGNPSFMISDGELVLVETHSTGGGGAGPFYGGVRLQQRLQEAITQLAPGYRFRTKNL